MTKVRNEKGQFLPIQDEYTNINGLTKVERYRLRHPERVKETSRKSELKRKNDPELLRRKRIRNLTKRMPLNPRCWFCPSHRNLQRHHPDYSESTIYITCCKDCHPYVDASTKEI